MKEILTIFVLHRERKLRALEQVGITGMAANLRRKEQDDLNSNSTDEEQTAIRRSVVFTFDGCDEFSLVERPAVL